MKPTCKRCHRVAKYRGLCKTHFEAVGVHGYVDAGPTRERIALLRSRGYSIRELASRAGVSMPTLRCEHDRVQLATARAIMGIPVPAKLTDRGAAVATIGTHRRVQALVAAGWPQVTIAEHAGIDPRHLSHVLRRPSFVTAATATRIAAVFDELHMQPGPSRAARARGRRNGWPLPLAWDEELIDDPQAQPAMPVATVTFIDRYAELRDMQLDDEEIARRLGIRPKSLERQLMRYGLFRAAS